MALTVNGVITIKSVQKKLEPGYNNSQKTVYYGVLATKEMFGQGLMDIDFRFECRNDKQVSFFDNYLMKYEGSGYATGKLMPGPNGLAVQLMEFEFGSFKLNSGGGNNNGNGGYSGNNNGYGGNNSGGFANQGSSQGGGQPQISPSFGGGNGGNGGNNLFQQGNNINNTQGSNEVAGAVVPEGNENNGNGGNIWDKFKKN